MLDAVIEQHAEEIQWQSFNLSLGKPVDVVKLLEAALGLIEPAILASRWEKKCARAEAKAQEARWELSDQEDLLDNIDSLEEQVKELEQKLVDAEEVILALRADLARGEL